LISVALALTPFSLIFRCLSVPFYGDAEKCLEGQEKCFWAPFGRTAWTFLNPPFDIAVERAGVVEKWRVERGEWWLGKKSGNGQMKMRWLTLLQHDGLYRLMTKI